jgi:hypothetical protein
LGLRARHFIAGNPSDNHGLPIVCATLFYTSTMSV